VGVLSIEAKIEVTKDVQSNIFLLDSGCRVVPGIVASNINAIREWSCPKI
jgi:hypothetical protein